MKGQLKMALLKMQSLVDAAGEALGLIEDPLLTPVGIKVRMKVGEIIIEPLYSRLRRQPTRN